MTGRKKERVGVSILIPTYNTSKYISRCLDSVFRQDIDDFEVVIIDDQSTDGTYELVEEYAQKDPRIRLYRNERNLGAGYTKNRALSLCEGKYTCFVDSDDWLDDGTLGCLLSLAENSQCDDIYFEMQSINEGEVIDGAKNQEPQIKSIYTSGVKFFEDMLDSGKVTVAACHHFLKREIITESVHFSEGTINDDWIFSVRLYPCIGKMIVLSNSYYNYFHRKQGSLTNRAKTESMIAEIYRQADEIYQDDLLGVKSKKLQEKVFLCRMAELQNEILARKEGWQEQYHQVMKCLEENTEQMELFQRSKNLSVYGSVDPVILERVRTAEKVYVYGMGAYGQDVQRILKVYQIPMASFVTTGGEEGSLCVDELKPEEDCFVIIAVSNKYKEAICQELEKRRIRAYGCLVTDHIGR